MTLKLIKLKSYKFQIVKTSINKNVLYTLIERVV